MRWRLGKIEWLKPRRNLVEAWGAAVILRKGLPVVLCPLGTFDFGLANGLVIFTLDLDRNRQPLHPLWRLDLVAVPPVAPGVLHVVIEDEFIHCSDHVETALPWDVVRLEDGDFFHVAFALAALQAWIAS